MKNIKLISLALIVTTFFSCSSDNTLSGLPECINNIVKSILKTKPQTSRANIKKYLYNTKDVFVVSAQNYPDGEAIVMDVDCNQICTLGGIDGLPSAACSDFNDNAVFIETVWTDPR